MWVSFSISDSMKSQNHVPMLRCSAVFGGCKRMIPDGGRERRNEDEQHHGCFDWRAQFNTPSKSAVAQTLEHQYPRKSDCPQSLETWVNGWLLFLQLLICCYCTITKQVLQLFGGLTRREIGWCLPGVSYWELKENTKRQISDNARTHSAAQILTTHTQEEHQMPVVIKAKMLSTMSRMNFQNNNT